MTRLEELTLNLADEVLTDAEARELQAMVAESGQVRQAHIRLLQIEAGLRTQTMAVELTAEVMAGLRRHVAESVTKSVMTQIRTQPAPERARQGGSELDAPEPASRRWSFLFLGRSSGWSLKHAWLSLVTCLALAAGLGIWFFGPTMGEPVLAAVRGNGLIIERSGQRLPSTSGVHLLPGDVLRTPENVTAVIGFAPEKTLLRLRPNSELQIVSLSSGKHFDLHAGELEASVTRQRPFHPMIVTTPQAVAHVVGTKFSLSSAGQEARLEVTEGKVRFTRTQNGDSALVPGGYYAVVANATELAALPQTGGLLREWWTGVKGKTRFSLSEDPRFPDHPDGRTSVPDFELKIAETNQYAVRLCGYVHPPVTGDYQFWLERPPADFDAVGFANLMMSPTASPSDAVPIAQTGGGGMLSPYVTVGATKAPPPVPLVAGRRYYLEARILIGHGPGDLSVAWQPPGQSREVLSGKFLSPFKPK